MIKAIFMDFYGTVVFEDGEVIEVITKEILDTGKADKDIPKGVKAVSNLLEVLDVLS